MTAYAIAGRIAVIVLGLLAGGCPAPTETQTRALGPATGGPTHAFNTSSDAGGAAPLPAITGADGYLLLPERMNTPGDAEAVDCIAKAIASSAPTARSLPLDTVRDALFPWLEPGTKPRDDEELLELVKRPNVHERLGQLKLRYVVHVGGRRLDGPPRNNFMCAPPVCTDLTVQNVGAQLSATVFDLREGVALGGAGAASRGSSTVFVVGVIPIMFLAPTGSRVCSEVGTAIARAFAAGQPPGDSRPR